MSKIKIFGLGGLNENGKNMYIVEVDQDIFVFDAGLKYADDKMLGVDYIIPNFDYLKNNKERIKGIFITHGHDNQMGAIPDIIGSLPDVKIYGMAFTIELLKTELEQDNIVSNNLIEIKAHKKISFGKNSIFPISLTHSVPDNVGFVLNTENGAIFYTGNFVFDPTLVGAYSTDIGKLAYVGKQGVLCLLSESLYADKSGYTSPKHRVTPIIRETILKAENRIIFNIVQAQLTRIQELFDCLKNTDRKVVIIGKRLQTTVLKAIDIGYLNFDKSRIVGLNHVNDEKIVIMLSDEREKPFSRLNRIVRGIDKFVKINNTDTVLFASPTYDGMEKSATKIYDKLAKIGAQVIIASSKKFLGNHASSQDLMMMINLMNPKYYFPVIGEYRHQIENAKAASAVGIKEENILLKTNGQVVEFVDGNLTNTNEIIKVDEILIDGKTIGDIGELVLKDRELLSDNGIVIVSVTLDRATKKILAGPEILTRGFIYVKDNAEIIHKSQSISLEVVKEFTKTNYIDFNKIKSGVRDKLGKYLYSETECKPMILIVINEV